MLVYLFCIFLVSTKGLQYRSLGFLGLISVTFGIETLLKSFKHSISPSITIDPRMLQRIGRSDRSAKPRVHLNTITFDSNIFRFEIMNPFIDDADLPWPTEMSWMWKRSSRVNSGHERNKRLRDMFHNKIPYVFNYWIKRQPFQYQTIRANTILTISKICLNRVESDLHFWKLDWNKHKMLRILNSDTKSKGINSISDHNPLSGACWLWEIQKIFTWTSRMSFRRLVQFDTDS